jgi:hypothetical protein
MIMTFDIEQRCQQPVEDIGGAQHRGSQAKLVNRSYVSLTSHRDTCAHSARYVHAWAANYSALAFIQRTGLSRFASVRPQRWVIASYEHHTSRHGVEHPHVHNVVIPHLTSAM